MKEQFNQSDVEVMQIPSDKWEVLRDLKLFSLTEEPIALENPIEGTEKYNKRTEKEWRHILSGGMSGERAGETIMFFARIGDEYIGMISSIVPEVEDGQDKDVIIQHMYVKKDFRGRGAGRKLITSLLENLQSRGDLAKANLDVVVTQDLAINLYKSVGFQVTRMTEGAIDWTEKSLDKLNMELRLR